MKICNDIKAFVENPDSFTINNPKKVFLFSVILKVIAITSLVFATCYCSWFGISTLFSLNISLFCDYKLLSKIHVLAYEIIQEKINITPHKSSYYFGVLFAKVIKEASFDSMKEFYKGFKNEYFA